MPGESIGVESMAAELQPLRSTNFERSSTFRRWPQYIAVFFATLGGASAGLVGGWTSNATPALRARGLPEPALGWVGALPAAGALLGALPAGLLAAALGRRRLLAAAAVPTAAAWLAVYFAIGDLDYEQVPIAESSTFTAKVWLLVSGRALLGVAMGVATVVAPLYSEESCDVAVRGRLGVAQNLQIDAGILLAYALGAAGASLEAQTLVPVAVPLVQLAALLWIPESPAHLAAAPAAEAARRAPKAARWLRLEMDPLERRRREAAARGGRAAPPARVRCRALLIVLGLMTSRQLLGINAFIYYTVDIFREADSSLSPEMATLVVGIVQVLARHVYQIRTQLQSVHRPQFVATALSAALVERAGRRPLLLASGAVAALSHAALALAASPSGAGLHWLPLVAVNACFVAFSVGFGSLPWFITAEVAPSPDAAWMTGLAVAANWSLIFTVTKAFPESVAALGRVATFSGLSVLSALTTLFALLFVPETRGKPRDVIQRELLEGSFVVLACCARSPAGKEGDATLPLAEHGGLAAQPRYT